LVASLAFNFGFGTTFGVRTYRHYCCGGGGGGAECAVRQDVLAQLDLTPEQQQGMTAARDRMLNQVDELRQQLTAEREKLVDLLTAANPTGTRLRPNSTRSPRSNARFRSALSRTCWRKKPC